MTGEEYIRMIKVINLLKDEIIKLHERIDDLESEIGGMK
jgi:hypothetical protein